MACFNELIKEDHFLRVTTRMFEILWCAGLAKRPTTWICLGRLSTPRRQSSHPRGIRLFTCQRTTAVSSRSVNGNFRRLCRGFPYWGAESYRRFRPCQRGVQKNPCVGSEPTSSTRICLSEKNLSVNDRPKLSPDGNLRRFRDTSSACTWFA